MTGLHRGQTCAILNKCAASIARITALRVASQSTQATAADKSPATPAVASFFHTPVPPFHIPDCLDGNEGHPARRFAGACGAAGFHCGALMDGNEITGAALRKAEGGSHTLFASDCAGAAPVLINSFHFIEVDDV